MRTRSAVGAGVVAVCVGVAGGIAIATPRTQSGKLTKVYFTRDTSARVVPIGPNDNTWTDMPGSATTINVPSGTTAIAIAYPLYSGGGSCASGGFPESPSLHLAIDGKPFPVNQGSLISMDATPVLSAGTHTVSIQYKCRAGTGGSPNDNLSYSFFS
jgi:hypothetical protein